MDDPYAHIIEYRSYLLSISVVLTINDIIGCSMFFPDCNNEHTNGALNMVYFYIFS